MIKKVIVLTVLFTNIINADGLLRKVLNLSHDIELSDEQKVLETQTYKKCLMKCVRKILSLKAHSMGFLESQEPDESKLDKMLHENDNALFKKLIKDDVFEGVANFYRFLTIAEMVCCDSDMRVLLKKYSHENVLISLSECRGDLPYLVKNLLPLKSKIKDIDEHGASLLFVLGLSHDIFENSYFFFENNLK